jgi:hypothetical protein
MRTKFHCKKMCTHLMSFIIQDGIFFLVVTIQVSSRYTITEKYQGVNHGDT